MNELVVEFLLRLAKVGAATILGVLIYLVAVGPMEATSSVELWLLCWLCGAAAVLIMESSAF